MQWLFVRVMIDWLSAMTVLDVFFTCHTINDVISTLQHANHAELLGIAVALTFLISAPLEILAKLLTLLNPRRDPASGHRQQDQARSSELLFSEPDEDTDPWR